MMKRVIYIWWGKMNKIIFVGNSTFSVGPLKALVESSNNKVDLVITQEDRVRSRGKVTPSPVKKFALENDLQVYTTNDINSQESYEKINSLNPDFIIVVSFGQLIQGPLLEKYKNNLVNIHSSLLPKYRGSAPIHYALLNGDAKTGVSIMMIEEAMDTGDVLKKCEYSLKEENYEELSERLSHLGGECLVEVLDEFDYYYSNKEKQDENLSSYTKFIKKDMGLINFNDNFKAINGKFKAFSSWPKISLNYHGDQVKIIDFYSIDKLNNHEAGQVFEVNDEGIYVNCKDKTMVITEIQMPGKKPVKVRDFLRGNDFEKINISF